MREQFKKHKLDVIKIIKAMDALNINGIDALSNALSEKELIYLLQQLVVYPVVVAIAATSKGFSNIKKEVVGLHKEGKLNIASLSLLALGNIVKSILLVALFALAGAIFVVNLVLFFFKCSLSSILKVFKFKDLAKSVASSRTGENFINILFVIAIAAVLIIPYLVSAVLNSAFHGACSNAANNRIGSGGPYTASDAIGQSVRPDKAKGDRAVISLLAERSLPGCFEFVLSTPARKKAV